MSHTGNDPHGSVTKGPVAKSIDEQLRLEELDCKGQWARCRSAGLTVHIFHRDSIHGELNAWIKADDLEAYLRGPVCGPDLSGDCEGVTFEAGVKPEDTKTP
jgi:hypothetical protein